MAYVNTGTSRSLRISVNRTVGGIPVQGYPKIYDGQLYFGNPSHPVKTDQEMQEMSPIEFGNRYAAFIQYVEACEPGVDFDFHIVGDGAYKADASCYVPFNELLKYSYSPSTVCSETVSSQYFGDNHFFASATKISSNQVCCLPTHAGYYSDGIIWKYTADGTNFSQTGSCTTTTTTTAAPVNPTSTLYVAKASNSAVNICTAATMNVYSASPFLQIGTRLFIDAGLTIQFSGYSFVNIDGYGDVWQVEPSGLDSGRILGLSESACV